MLWIIPLRPASLATGLTAVLLVATTASSAPAATHPGSDPLAATLARVAREALPTVYEKQHDWGRTKSITRGVKLTGRRLAKLSLRRTKRDVRHGHWRKYRVEVLDPAERLVIDVTRLRPLGPGKAGCTLVVSAELDGWAQTRRFNRGVHLGTMTYEGRSKLRAEIDCEVAISLAAGQRGIAARVTPEVTGTRVQIEEFRLTRAGEIRGGLAREIGKLLRRVVEDRLEDSKLTDALNRAITKRPEKLQVELSALTAFSSTGGGSP